MVVLAPGGPPMSRRVYLSHLDMPKGDFRSCAGFWTPAATARGRDRHGGVQKPAHERKARANHSVILSARGEAGLEPLKPWRKTPVSCPTGKSLPARKNL